jgi:hypothetical protein
VLDQQNRQTGVAQGAQAARKLAGFGVVEAGGRLVEEQQGRLQREGACDLEMLLLPIRQVAGRLVGEGEQVEALERGKCRLGDGFVAFAPELRHQRAEQRDAEVADGAGRDVVEHRDVGKDAQVLVRACDAEARNAPGIEARDRPALESTSPFVRAMAPATH